MDIIMSCILAILICRKLRKKIENNYVQQCMHYLMELPVMIPATCVPWPAALSYPSA